MSSFVKYCFSPKKWNIKKELLIILPMILFTYIGVLLRIGIEALVTENKYLKETFDSNTLFNPVFVPNIIGSFFMGILVVVKPVYFNDHNELFTSISTGFAGSCTSYSSFSTYSGFLLAKGRILDFLLNIFFGWSSSFFALKCGLRFAALYKYIPINKCKKSKKPLEEEDEHEETEIENNVNVEIKDLSKHPILYYILLIGSFILCFAVFLTFLLLAIFIPDMLVVSITIFFAPLGSFTRYYTSKYNDLVKNFPVFTFLVNVVGSVLLALIDLIIIENGDEDLTLFDEYKDIANILLAFGVGAIGSLTTVSTFVKEANNLNSSYDYIYVFTTFIITQFFLIIINGIYYWR
eukprot:TRINITY_DN1360_c0_g1_i1.p1 TRINITY_DN1360_c0_g1~~TRINITY_DN1360_c0_g1_i1.p1  ORF type:complete len:350 (+),score=41.24 TRINITY_DN1360_c0_g1_i1:97-1146(+)